MKKSLTVLVLALFSVSAVAGVSFSESEKDGLKEGWNEAEIPGAVTFLVEGEVVNVESEDIEIGVRFDGKNISEIQNSHYEDATVKVNIDQDAVKNLENSEDKMQTYKQLRESNAITFEKLDGSGETSSSSDSDSEEVSGDEDKGVIGSIQSTVSSSVSGVVTSAKVAVANILV